MLSRFRHFIAFFGSGLIVSVAYMDPGNWGTNIEGGARFDYDLLWVIWMASGMAMLFQYLSGKLGICGFSLPELVQKKLRNRFLIFLYWILSEFAILATDLAEFLGIVVALNLLFGIPMLIGTWIAVADVLIILILAQKRFRRLEQAFVLFVGIIGLAFVYELFLTKPNLASIVFHSISPILDRDRALVSVGIIGATVMPHALFVHSWLIKNKIIEGGYRDKKKTLGLHRLDTIISLSIAGLINASMLIMAASAFYKVTKVATLQEAYQTLIPLFGPLSAIVFAIALLSAGLSSSITGTLSGQAIMDGLMGFRINIWVRRLVTRVINVIPLTFALLAGFEPLKLLVISQVILSLLIPLPLIPIILFSSDRTIMGDLVNKKITTIFASIFGLVILFFNGYLLVSL